MRLRNSASLRPRRIEAASASASPAGHDKTVSLSAPVTSGNAPPVVATKQIPVDMASIAGRLNPSYRLGTTASSLSAYNSTMRSSLTPETWVMQSVSPSLRMRSAFAPSRGRPMMVRCTSRSVRIFASASSKYDKPLSATSADAVVMRWPGLRAMCGSGVNKSGSTPTGTSFMRSSDTFMSV